MLTPTRPAVIRSLSVLAVSVSVLALSVLTGCASSGSGSSSAGGLGGGSGGQVDVAALAGPAGQQVNVDPAQCVTVFGEAGDAAKSIGRPADGRTWGASVTHGLDGLLQLQCDLWVTPFDPNAGHAPEKDTSFMATVLPVPGGWECRPDQEKACIAGEKYQVRAILQDTPVDGAASIVQEALNHLK